MLRAICLFSLLLVVAAPTSFSEAACAPNTATYHVSFLRPWADTYSRTLFDDDGCQIGRETVSITCDHAPIVENGPVYPHTGLRDGTYSFSCQESVEMNRETGATYENGELGARCEYVPYLAVLGQPVPGSDATHCTLDASETTVAPEDPTPAVPLVGAFSIKHRETGYSWSTFSPAELPLCLGNAEAGDATLGVRVTYMECR